MGKPANYEIEKETSSYILIRDKGPWNVHFTVTNDAEGVVERLTERAGGTLKKRIGYYDSEGEVGEIVHDGKGRFAGFQHGFSW